MADINVTPMVDVMLVLLVIFMVTAPLMQHGVSVDLPKADAPAVVAEKEHLVLTLTAERQIYLGDVEIPRDVLRERLIGNKRLASEKHVFLHADHRLDYGFVVDVMAVMQTAGVENMGMITDPVAPKPGI
jgi:biopolymer transport protein TolR